MFEVSHEEILRCQIGTSSWGGSRYGAFAFLLQRIGFLREPFLVRFAAHGEDQFAAGHNLLVGDVGGV